MAELSDGSSCPTCREGTVQRRRRRKWLKWVPGSKYYKCRSCRARFLTVFGWVILLPKKKESFAAED